MSISDNIKELRTRYNLTQSELGEIAGVTDKAVSTWENGTAEPRTGALEKIAAHFGIRKSDIISDDEIPYFIDPETADIVQALHDRPELKVMFDATRKASPEDLEIALMILNRGKSE